MKDWLESDLARYEREQEEYEEALPHCCVCGNAIYDDYAYKWDDGDIFCEECFEEFVKNEYRVSTDRLVEEYADMVAERMRGD